MSKQKCPYKKSKCEFVGVGNCPFPNNGFEDDQCMYVYHPCKSCPQKGGKYKNFGSPDSKVMVVGGSNMDTPVEFIKEALQRASDELNLPVPYYFTTAVKCIADKKPSMAVIKRCNDFLKDEIKIIQPKYVLVIGESAFKALLWDFDLITRRKPELNSCAGSHIEQDGIIYLPVHDMKAIEKNSAHRFAFTEHLKKFIKLINGILKITPVKYKEVESEKELVYIAQEAERTGRVAVDIETGSLTPFLKESEILTISFTVKERESFCVPLSWRSGSYFKKWNFAPKLSPFNAIPLINRILKNDKITKIFHNGVFDIMWLEHIFNLQINNYDDTMIMKFLMNQNEQDKKSLKYLTKQFLDMGFYEYNISQYNTDESYANIPPKILMEYNNSDTDATLRLWNRFRPQLKELGLENIHYNFMIPKLRGIINLQKSGIALDTNRCIELKEENDSKLVELFSELRALSQVANFERETGLEFKPSSANHTFAMVYGGEITTEEEVPRRVVNGRKVGKKEKRKVYYNGFNLAPITVSAKSTVTGKREQRKSFSKKAIQKYLKSIYKDLKYLDPINTFNLSILPCNTDLMKFIKLSTEISSIQTQLSNHIKPFINLWAKTIDKCVHTSYNITGTTTGRLACIAKGTMIEVVRDVSKFPKGIPIEEVNVGDLAYTYDDNNNLCLKKIKWAGGTGHKKCVRVHWVGRGQHHKGYIDLTYDHKVRLVKGGWKEAGSLQRNDRILALSRSKTTGYSRLHCYKNKEIRDHIFIMKQSRDIPSGYHVHHKDYNKLNNELDNLEVLSQIEHIRLHYNSLSIEQKRVRTLNILNYDRSRIDWKKVGLNKRLRNRPLKFTLLRMLANSGGRLLTTSKQYGYDFDTLKQYIKSYGIEWGEVRHRYGADGKFLFKGRIHKVVEKCKTIRKVAQELRIGTVLAKFYISNNNHLVTRLEHIGYRDVYNLEVADTHRYIANELCVKNSSTPNLQNLSREGFVKEAFTSRWKDEGILIESDYKQLELFVMAIVSQDKKFVEAFTHGLDLHLKTAANIVFRCTENKVTKQMRTMAKTVNFGMLYGKTAFTLKDDLNVSEEEAQRIIDGFFTEYIGVKRYSDSVREFAQSHRYVTTVMGRRRYLDYSDPNGADRQAVNTTIQSPASDICVTAISQLQEYFLTVNKSIAKPLEAFVMNSRKQEEIAVVCGTVHDSIIIDCKKKYINEIVQATRLIMENTNLSWVTIPLKVDIKYGPNLKNTIEWDGKSRIEV